MPSGDAFSIICMTGPVTALAVWFLLGFPFLLLRRPIGWLWNRLARIKRRIPDWIVLLCIMLPYGFFGMWADYLLIIRLREPFTLTTVVVITLLWIPFAFMVAAMGSDDHSGKEPTPASSRELVVVFLSIPVGSLLGGIYLLSGAHWLPFEREFLALLTLKSADLLGLSFLALLILFASEMVIRKLNTVTRQSHGDSQDRH